MNRIVRIIFIAAFFLLSGLTFLLAKDLFYLGQLNIRLGFQFGSNSDSWKNSLERTLHEDVFLSNNSEYNSSNVDVSNINNSQKRPIISIEGNFGLNLKNFPGLKNVKALKKFQGLRMGFSTYFYPFSSNESYTYNGAVVFNNSNPIDANLSVMDYTSEVKVSEDIFIIAPSLNIFYYYEKGLFSKKIFSWQENKLIPFAGIELGMGLLSGLRKTILTSDPVQKTIFSQTRKIQIEANIQENYFNTVSFRLGFVLGAQLHVHNANFIELRFGYIYHRATLMLQRSGIFTESSKYLDGMFLYSYSEKVKDETREVTYSLSGFFIMLGYTVRLF